MLEAARILAWPVKWRAEGLETGAFAFQFGARETKIQFAPHRAVTSYADYRKLGAGKGWLFG